LGSRIATWSRWLLVRGNLSASHFLNSSPGERNVCALVTPLMRGFSPNWLRRRVHGSPRSGRARPPSRAHQPKWEHWKNLRVRVRSLGASCCRIRSDAGNAAAARATSSAQSVSRSIGRFSRQRMKIGYLLFRAGNAKRSLLRRLLSTC
jgi:hypothetical protein